MIEFIWPLAFILLPLPVVYRFIRQPAKTGTRGAIQVPFYQIINPGQSQQGQVTTNRFNFKLITSLLIWCLLVTALSRPAWVGEKIPLPVSGRDLMVAIDLSGSMGHKDFFFNGHATDRLNVVKATADDFIQRRKTDRIGLILFSNRAYVQAPLTLDHAAVNTLLNEAQVGLTGKETAIGDAIAIATKRLKDRPTKSKVLILLTDGASNAGVMQPLQAAKIAKELGIRIYTIGVGSANQSNQNLFGQPLFNPSGDLDEPTLQEIAQITGGKFFRAYDLNNLASIYAELDKLEPDDDKPVFLAPSISLYFWPLGTALLIFGLLVLRLLPPRSIHRNTTNTLGVIN